MVDHVRGPGSGKSTIGLIKTSYEISKLMPCQKILFLSFARATVARIIESSAEFVTASNLKSLEINTYHSFFWSVLKAHGYLISNETPLKLISPAEAAVCMYNIPTDARHDEFCRLYLEEGIIGFDLFASKVAELFQRSDKLRKIYSRAFPLIILDEFQDTNPSEWEVVKLLGKNSRIIALADTEQRIYDFRGADPARISQYIKQFNPQVIDFGDENNRSNDTDILLFGNDLLIGNHLGKNYTNVSIILYPPYRGKHEMFLLKTKLLAAKQSLNKIDNWSIAVLVPTKNLMLRASNYLSSTKDNLPSIIHDVAIDAEGPTIAGGLIFNLMENLESIDEIKKIITEHLINYLKGKKGTSPPTKSDLNVVTQLNSYLEGKTRKIKILNEINQIAEQISSINMTGNPFDDWLLVIRIFKENSSNKQLCCLIEDACYVRLLYKGSNLRELLAQSWRENNFYSKAKDLYLTAIQKENFSTTVKNFSGIHVMTIHKSKGKQFDEVFIFEGFKIGRIVVNPTESKSIECSKLTLRVAVTRAKRHTTIITPKSNKCELL
ncbi:UvrD-helicase domain-containing protein [Legionella quinlivanii]|uniref:UvrD-helicase domain-containing protein n=1 Tax=Legionella quinlivanii TaxID=45073 RepID=UPI002243D358|nr:UvrD-helicase domain-containing protein [Legionella quinlivanii]MCW8451801.1 UvrD-helicase domain-containing protein [Legionella quinlivanii]